jgi:hypothetical protein
MLVSRSADTFRRRARGQVRGKISPGPIPRSAVGPDRPPAAAPDVPRPVSQRPLTPIASNGDAASVRPHATSSPTHPTARARTPHVPSLGDLGLCSVPVEDAFADTDLALIVTAHHGVDHELIASRTPAVLDLRGVLSGGRASHVVGLYEPKARDAHRRKNTGGGGRRITTRHAR